MWMHDMASRVMGSKGYGTKHKVEQCVFVLQLSKLDGVGPVDNRPSPTNFPTL